MYVHVCASAHACSMLVCVHVRVHAYLCALLVHKYQNLGSHNFYFSFNCANSIYPLNLVFVVAIILSAKSGPK